MTNFEESLNPVQIKGKIFKEKETKPQKYKIVLKKLKLKTNR